MVKNPTSVLSDGLPAVEAACAAERYGSTAFSLDEGVHAADVVLNILARRREVILRLLTITTMIGRAYHPLPWHGAYSGRGDALKLRHEPVATIGLFLGPVTTA
jgi:hypothetical protein